jgi:hypothetical protein
MKITREQIVEMIKEEMGPMMDMGMDMGMGMHGGGGHSAQGGFVHKDSVARRDCCAAVMCLVECCSCPVTREKLMACCEDLMAGRFDR